MGSARIHSARSLSRSTNSSATGSIAGIARGYIAAPGDEVRARRLDANLKRMRLAVEARRLEPQRVLTVQLVGDANEGFLQVRGLLQRKRPAAGLGGKRCQPRIRLAVSHGASIAENGFERDGVDHHVLGSRSRRDGRRRHRTDVVLSVSEDQDHLPTGDFPQFVEAFVNRFPEPGAVVDRPEITKRLEKALVVTGKRPCEPNRVVEGAELGLIVLPQSIDEF